MLDHEYFVPVVTKVLESMRTGEIARAEVSPKYLENDPESVKYYNLDPSKPLFFRINLKEYVSVIDWY